MKTPDTTARKEKPANPEIPAPTAPAVLPAPGSPPPFINWRWFSSRTVRQAGQMRKHVEKLVSAQRDILSPKALAAMEAAMLGFKKAAPPPPGRQALLDYISK